MCWTATDVIFIRFASSVEAASKPRIEDSLKIKVYVIKHISPPPKISITQEVGGAVMTIIY